MLENLDQKDTVFLHSGWLTYLAVFVISIWGGMVSYLGRKGEFSWRKLFAHLTSASFAGMMTAFGCEYAGISGPLMGVLCGVAAHMGTPALIRLAMKLKVVREFFAEDKKDKG